MCVLALAQTAKAIESFGITALAADWGMTGNPEVMPQRRPHFLPSNRHPREQTRRAGRTQAEIGS
jgi:hypothetical protein